MPGHTCRTLNDKEIEEIDKLPDHVLVECFRGECALQISILPVASVASVASVTSFCIMLHHVASCCI